MCVASPVSKDVLPELFSDVVLGCWLHRLGGRRYLFEFEGPSKFLRLFILLQSSPYNPSVEGGQGLDHLTLANEGKRMDQVSPYLHTVSLNPLLIQRFCHLSVET